MQAQRRNIELKATDPDPSVSLEVCRTLGAEDHGTIAVRPDTLSAMRANSCAIGAARGVARPDAGWLSRVFSNMPSDG